MGIITKEKYRRLCETEETIPLFSRDWWLDIACGEDNWNVITSEYQNMHAAMTLYTPLPHVVTMPPYTQTMGPWFSPAPGDAKYTSLLGRKQVLCAGLIDELYDYTSFHQRFPYTVTDWLPFYWKGYKQTTRYTYVLPDITDNQKLWEDMSTNTRRNITKAKDKNGIIVKKGISTDDFLQVFRSTFLRQGKPVPKDTDVLVRLIEGSRERGQGDLWGGYDDTGRLHAAAFIVWQKSSAYYIAGGGDSDLRDSGAQSLVMWEAIQYISRFTTCFDFEGSMIQGIERFFRGFGAKQLPYFTIIKGKLSLISRFKLKLLRNSK